MFKDINRFYYSNGEVRATDNPRAHNISRMTSLPTTKEWDSEKYYNTTLVLLRNYRNPSTAQYLSKNNINATHTFQLMKNLARYWSYRTKYNDYKYENNINST